MTADALGAAATARPFAVHEESQGPWPEMGHVCIECWQMWPCDATRLLAALGDAIEDRDHHADCPAFDFDSVADCTCGLRQAMALLQQGAGHAESQEGAGEP